MSNESKELKKIHDIRLSIYEETKDMTPEERAVYYSDFAREAVEKYGLKVVTYTDVHKRKVM